jgi:hypothetical protein
MGKPTNSELEPVFGMYGAAVYQGQLMENGLLLLLDLIDESRRNQGKKPRKRPDLEAPDAPRTLGRLLGELSAATHVTDAERRAIQAGIHKRNLLVHAYWRREDRGLALLTVKGRRWLIKDLDALRASCRKAGRIIDGLIDDLLREYGNTIAALSEPMFQCYENDRSVPPEVLR